MSVPPIDTPVGSFEVRCRVGQFVMDSDDEDRAPDLVAVGGTVTIEPDLRRPIRVMGEQGPRVVHVSPLEFTIDPATGKLVHPDGDAGVELIDPTDEHLDPQGWTYTATVRPEQGRSWDVTFGAPTDGGIVDLGGVVTVAPSPGVTQNYMQETVEARDQAESFAVRAEMAASKAEDYAPNFDWDGTQLVIDGETGPDLQGPAGPPVESIDDVPGLQAIIDRLTYDSGWRDVSSLLPAGLAVSTSSNGRALVKRRGDRLLVELHLDVSAPGITTVIPLPTGWRPDVKVLTPYAYWTSSTTGSALPGNAANGYIGAGGVSLRSGSLPNPGTVLISLDLLISTPPPTTFPGPIA